MAGEWVKRKIGALGRVVTGKTPPTADSSNFGGPYPFITIPDLDGRVFINSSERTLSEKGAELLRSCLLPPGAVMMSCIATVGKCGITTRPSFTNQQINSVIPNDGVDSRFLYYVFTQLGHELESAGGGGSVYTNVSKNRFSDIEVVIPADLDEQRAIAHILGTLDDKIELNRRMSETLEQMARALFKAWFVDFEPVRAKMEGRWRRGESLPGLPAHLYDLFPDRLVDSELGEIPEGWEVTQLDDLANIHGGKQLPTEECKPIGTFPVFGANGIMGYTERTTHKGFVIAFGRVGAYCGSVHWTYSGAWINNNASSVVPIRWPEFILQAMLNADFEGMRTGSAQPFIPNATLAVLPILRPPNAVLDLFCLTVRQLRMKQEALHRQSRTLAALRDALLPKLISGELRVKDVERFLKERGL
ncbi:MAG: restriction endonuclease subunit S [Bacteroidia bacterium]|nr:restriction endonuclease subunit S [Bacteroidia bacterium]